MEGKDVWKTNKFAIQWKNKLANKKDNIKQEPDYYVKYLNRMWYAGNIIALVYILLVGLLIWLYILWVK